MSHVILICGKLAAGKSTYAEELRKARKAALLSCDRLMLSLFDPHLGDAHDTVAARTKHYLLIQSLELLEVGIPVILDWGFWTRRDREETRAFFTSRAIPAELHYVTLSEEAWQRNITTRNRAVEAGSAQAYFIDENLAAKCKSRFEEPTPDEIDFTFDNTQSRLIQPPHKCSQESK